MQTNGVKAMLPKARGIFAKRISAADYEELMRKRTVPEVAALLKRHPYFKSSLATLSSTAPSRAQLEELLNMDIFLKYLSLVHYDLKKSSFSVYYLMECEIREVLRALHLLSIGLLGNYLTQVPAYLVGKTGIDLFALGQAQSFAQLLDVVKLAPYHKALRARFLADPGLKDFPAVEAALLQSAYAHVFALIAKDLNGREAAAVKDLFLQEVEEYNIQLIVRVKTYFPELYTKAELASLLMPYYWRVGKHCIMQLAQAKSAQEVIALLRNTPGAHYGNASLPDELAAEGGHHVYRHAKMVLHLTNSPYASLAALVSLAKLERDNIVTVIEGVRYGLKPEEMRTMLKRVC